MRGSKGSKGTVLLLPLVQGGQVHCPSLDLTERDNGPVPL